MNAEQLIDRLLEAGKVCKSFSTRNGGTCNTGCKEKNIPRGGTCGWGADNENDWDGAKKDCPCYKDK